MQGAEQVEPRHPPRGRLIGGAIDDDLESLDGLPAMEAGAEAEQRSGASRGDRLGKRNLEVDLELSVHDTCRRLLGGDTGGHRGANLAAVESAPAMWEGKTVS